MQKAPKLEILKGLKLGHLPTIGRRALGVSYDLENDKMVLKYFESHFPGENQLCKYLRLGALWHYSERRAQRTDALPLEARKVCVLNVLLLNLYEPRGHLATTPQYTWGS